MTPEKFIASKAVEAVKAIYQATGADGHRRGFGGPPPGGPR